jgi:hypothetical protein
MYISGFLNNLLLLENCPTLSRRPGIIILFDKDVFLKHNDWRLLLRKRHVRRNQRER